MTKSEKDNINPSHYKSHPSGIECIQITRHFNFNLGNAIKYIWRAGEKGDRIEDLKKAQWYINDEIKTLELQRARLQGVDPMEDGIRYAKD